MELQRLYLLVTISLLAVVSAGVLPARAATEFCVVPTEQSLCPCSVICHTFDFYLASPEVYFKSGVTFQFLPGVHNISRSFSGSGIAGLNFFGTNATVVVNSSTNSSWLSLYHSSQIAFSGLDIWVGNSKKSDKSLICNMCIVELNNVSGIQLSKLSLNNSCGRGLCLTNISTGEIIVNGTTVQVYSYGLYMHNVNGFVNISHSQFFGSQRDTLLSATYHGMINGILSIQHSQFHNGSGSIAVSASSLLSDDTIAFSLEIEHVNLTTPNGTDIWVYVINSEKERNESAAINVFVNDVMLLSHAKDVGIYLNLGDFNGQYNVTVNDCSIFSHYGGAIKVYLGNDRYSKVLIKNSVLKSNQGNRSLSPVSAMLIKGSTDKSSGPSSPVTLSNVTLESNYYIPSATDESIATVLLFYVDNATIIDCKFIGNTGTALYLMNSNVTTIGTITFANNSAYEGAALSLNGLSIIAVKEYSVFLFSNNTANHTGGAMHINNGYNDHFLDTLALPTQAKCFVSFEGDIRNTSVFRFHNNVAKNGGSAIYGGYLDQVLYGNYSRFNSCIEAVVMFSEFHTINTSNASLISSDPSRVCMCENNTARCLDYTKNISMYPGQAFHIPVYVVGQHFGSSKGTVYAQLLNKTCELCISEIRTSQDVNQYSCDQNNLTYTVLSPDAEHEQTLILTAEDVFISGYVDKYTIDLKIKEYIENGNLCVPSELLKLPVYIHINFLKCPAGFSHSVSKGSCTCLPIFSNHLGKNKVTCGINTQTVQRQHSVWIDASNTTAIYSQYCPLLYCNSTLMQVNLSQRDGADTQCVNHHSGVLCGACKMGYSLAIGSSHCLPHCSDNYLSLLLVFAAAGVLLVLFIKYLNLTVTQGMINGLIFCTNIVQTNKSVLLASDETAIRYFAAFIAWFNLDFGIETCFSEDLDIYAKTWLQFAFPLYLWVLAGGIIVACRYSQLATRFFGNNAVHVLATIFLLSYNKLLRIITTVYSSASIEIHDLSSNRTREEAVWAYDGNIRYLRSEHAALFAACTFVFVFLWLPFTLCILLGQWLQRYNHYRGLQWVGRVRPLLEAYYGPLKDRHRYWAGILLLARVVVIIPAADPLSSASASMFTVIILCTVLLLFTASIGGFYKKNYLTVMESAFFANLTSFAALWLYLDDANGAQDIAVYIMVGLFFLGFLIIVGIQLCTFLVNFIRKRGYLLVPHVSADLSIQSSLDEEEYEH